VSEETPSKGEPPAKILMREEFDRRYLLLAAVPLGVYLLFYFIIAQTRNAGIDFDSVACAQISCLAAEAKYRYFWISAFLVSGAVSLAVIASCAMSLYREMPPRHRFLIVSVVVSLVAVIAIYESFPGFFGLKRWYEYMGAGLYQSTLGKMPVTTGLEEGSLQSVLQRFEIGLNLVKILGATALIIIGFGSILTLSRITAEKAADSTSVTERQTEHLARKAALLKGYLYQGSAVYVFAMIAMMSWMFWPIPFLDADNTLAYRELVVGSAILQGVGYTLGAAAVYLPPAVLLRHRISRMAKQELVGHEGASVEAWLRQRGLHFQPLDELRQVAAMLLPAVISAMPALMNI